MDGCKPVLCRGTRGMGVMPPAPPFATALKRELKAALTNAVSRLQNCFKIDAVWKCLHGTVSAR